MIRKVSPNAWVVQYERYVECFQLILITNTGMQENVRSADRPSRQDNLFGGSKEDSVRGVGGANFDSADGQILRSRGFEDTGDASIDDDMQVLARLGMGVKIGRCSTTTRSVVANCGLQPAW